MNVAEESRESQSSGARRSNVGQCEEKARARTARPSMDRAIARGRRDDCALLNGRWSAGSWRCEAAVANASIAHVHAASAAAAAARARACRVDGRRSDPPLRDDRVFGFIVVSFNPLLSRSVRSALRSRQTRRHGQRERAARGDADPRGERQCDAADTTNTQAPTREEHE